MATILSIQSQVVRGHVGNSAAQPALQRLGHEVWAVPTVLLSNHPAHGFVAGGATDPARLAALLQALPLDGCDAVLSGYLGNAANAGAIATTINHARAANPRVLYFSDPVFAHEGGLFAPPDVADAQAGLARLADIAKPNQTELEHMTGRSIRTLQDALAACTLLRTWGPRTVVLSSLRRSDAPAGVIETLAAGRDGAFLIATPLLPGALHGAGDLFSALFLGFTLKGMDTRASLEAATSAAHGVLQATGTALDLALIAGLDTITAPAQHFTAQPVGPA